MHDLERRSASSTRDSVRPLPQRSSANDVIIKRVYALNAILDYNAPVYPSPTSSYKHTQQMNQHANTN